LVLGIFAAGPASAQSSNGVTRADARCEWGVQKPALLLSVSGFVAASTLGVAGIDVMHGASSVGELALGGAIAAVGAVALAGAAYFLEMALDDCGGPRAASYILDQHESDARLVAGSSGTFAVLSSTLAIGMIVALDAPLEDLVYPITFAVAGILAWVAVLVGL
jgi:hypothetical protein